MFVLDSLGRHVGQKIKNRGVEYFQRNSVSIVYKDSEFVSAEVRGTRTYDVDLELENDTLIYSCSCPFFEDKFKVCKHIWATLLEMNKQRILHTWDKSFPKELIPAYINPYEQRERESDSEYVQTRMDGDTRPLNERSYRNTVPPQQDWRHLLCKLKQTLDSDSNHQPCRPGSEILYVLEFSGQFAGFGPAIK
ncbi:MAG: SWIM zinc finger family protein, partial [Acidobacteriota bacterium]